MKRHMKALAWLLVGAALVVATAASGPWLAERIAYAVAKGQNPADRDQLAEIARNDQTSKMFRAVAKAVRPAVVEVRVTKMVEQPDVEQYFRRFFGEDELPAPFRRGGQGGQQTPKTLPMHGLGSGVIIDAEKGYVLTNYHVVACADEVEVVIEDGRKCTAEWVRSDAMSDVAIVKIKPDHLIAAPLGDSDKIEVGDCVLAIGAPRGLTQTVTSGIISALGRNAMTGGAPLYQNYIQTDAAINQGNSGGPLVNMYGEVIGINNSILTFSGGNEGIGFAVPSNMASKVMKQLIESGKVVRGYLGVRIQNVDEKLAKSFRLPGTKGALVAQVAPDGPAEKAGLKEGDFIVAVNGKSVSDVTELQHAIADVAPGQTAKTDVYRDGTKKTIDIKISEQPDDMKVAFGSAQPPAAATSRKFGLKVAAMTDPLAKQFGYAKTPKGVVVTDVDASADAAEQNIEPGMVITHVNGKSVATTDEFDAQISSKDAESGVRLQVQEASGAKRFVFLTPTKENGKESTTKGAKDKE